MNVSEITLYEILKTKFSAQEAEGIVSSLKEGIKEEFINQKDVFATKQDIADLKIAVKEDMLKMKLDIIKWVVGLFFAQAAMIIGLYLKK